MLRHRLTDEQWERIADLFPEPPQATLRRSVGKRELRGGPFGLRAVGSWRAPLGGGLNGEGKWEWGWEHEARLRRAMAREKNLGQ